MAAFHLAVFAMLAPPAFAQQDARGAGKFILDSVVRAADILRSHHLPRDQIERRVRDAFRNGFDLPTIISRALGTARRRMTAGQLASFRREFEELIVQTYTRRVLDYGPRVKSDVRDFIRVTGVTRDGSNQITVRSEINRSGANWVKIDWRVSQEAGRYRIIDIVFLGISQLKLYKAEFASVMRREGRGVDGLIEALRSKNAALRTD